MPHLLLIDTATEQATVAVTVDAGRVVSRSLQESREAALRLLPWAEAVLEEAGLDRGSLDAVAFSAGPGSFTGLRIGCAAAQGIAFALQIPVVSIPTLAILAQGACRQQSPADGSRLIPVLDARMDEIYWQVFVVQQGRALPLGEARVSPVGACRPDAGSAGPVYFCGPGVGLLDADVLAAWGDVQTGHEPAWPEVADFAALALQAWQEGRTCAPDQAVPLYVRNQVALTVEERARQAKQAGSVC